MPDQHPVSNMAISPAMVLHFRAPIDCASNPRFRTAAAVNLSSMATVCWMDILDAILRSFWGPPALYF
jgi:hypothetical protein